MNDRLKIIKNPDKEMYELADNAVKNNGGYCPCKLLKNEDTKCICKEFRLSKEEGLCSCGKFIKIKEEKNG